MIKGFFARMFPAHQWDEVDGRRTCSICERVEELNEVLGLSWDVTVKGDVVKHVARTTASADAESAPRFQVAQR